MNADIPTLAEDVVQTLNEARKDGTLKDKAVIAKKLQSKILKSFRFMNNVISADIEGNVLLRNDIGND